MKKLFITFVFCLAINVVTAIAQNKDSYVKMETIYGTMIFKLATTTLNHNKNFISLAKKKYFNNYTFNRVIKGFVVQGGETDSAYAAMQKADQQSVQYLNPEFSERLFHQRGALAAGRDDNKLKQSFKGQFYIVDGKKYTDIQLDAIEKRIGNGFKFSEEARKIYKEVGGVPHLDQNYTVFGQLVKGWDVLEQIANAKKDSSDQPLRQIKLKISMLGKKEMDNLGLVN